MTELENALKELVIGALNLENVKSEDISTEDPLFGEGLGLDSIDALELGVALKKKYQIALNVDDQEVKKHFYSIKTLAKFIEQSQAQLSGQVS